ncbi:hypothetical protein SAMN04487948_13124 [Halogranum amylolyticum]|uniref:Uncharacterized protein n=2 Tax=Halogranum amylolyticum TaxID=660520 RepID=A0A1H8WK34_9EURY|nr:hypothetical protein SAMN04487948_13124 [Halogranum amylolyticum]
MKGIGGLAALSMSGATIAEAEAAVSDSLASDPHTADTYRAIVDAIIPRTPELEAELGPEHVPGGVDVELEKFLVWDFNHFQEIRAEMVTDPGLLDSVPEEMMPTSLFETAFETTGSGSDLDALLDLADITLLDLVDDLEVTGDALEERLTLGPVERYEVSFADDVESTTGPAEFELVVETANETTHRVLQNYPYAPAFTIVFDVVAAEFLALGRNEDAISRDRTEFPAGGTFVQLSREDRLRCLWSIVDGSVVDRLDDLLSPLVPDVGILKYVVMAVNGLHGFGYYTEWSGLGETKTNTPNERTLATPPDEVQSREQSGYPGPEPGYAANWRHAVDGGFDDPDADELNLPSDLTGDDVLDGIGGDT